MAEPSLPKRRHFILEGVTTAKPFRGRGGGTGPSVPTRDRRSHAADLSRQLTKVQEELDRVRELQQAAGLDGGIGLQVEFESFPDVELMFEQLASQRAGIELLNVRLRGAVTLATVFVPDGKLEHFERIIGEYLNGKHDKNGRPRDHQVLVDAIRAIRRATLRALWTDDDGVFPQDLDEPITWEVWLPVGGHRDAVVDSFRRLAEDQELRVYGGVVRFPERTVLLLRASATQLSRSLLTLNSIAELRRAKQTDELILGLRPDEEAEWVADLLDRVQYETAAVAAPHVCLLDTGVNNGHPLLAPALADRDRHAVDPNHGVHDAEGHGTAMAGLALLGDLRPLFESNQDVRVGHRLESVKLLNGDEANGGDPQHHGYLTVEAVAQPEITAPGRPRAFAMAVTARDNRDRGRPSAWSAVLDDLAADSAGAGSSPRLFVVSAGNITDIHVWPQSPASNTTDGIHDPAQAWNVLTVGAYTEMIDIAENAPDYQPIAPAGGLSPFSTTSATWSHDRPLKPDVLFEGGNAGKDRYGAAKFDSLSLTTTSFQPHDRHLCTANATSAATALAGRMAAQLMDAYPELWPEGVRALMVHSATWTDAMRRAFLPQDRRPTKAENVQLVRHCGYGVPDLNRALWTAGNSLTMIVQTALQPYQRASGEPKLRDMHLHDLPWPQQALEDLGEIEVEMRVTLSYFIEPNPSARGSRSKYRYHSHGLRFDVRRPGESSEGFLQRVNLAARNEEDGAPLSTGDDSGWFVGAQARTKGSLHCDIWRGTAAELARRGVLAVYPTGGWWKTRKHLGRYDNFARYALVVSIHAPDVDVDLVTPVATSIGTPVEVAIGT